jgi:hypothetical protein
MRWIASLVIPTVLLLVACAEEQATPAPTQPAVTEPAPARPAVTEPAPTRPAVTSGGGQGATVSDALAHDLATIHKDTYVADDDPLVARFDRLLDSLDRKCAENRRGVSDVGVRAWQILDEEGQPMPLLDVMTYLDGSVPEEATGIDCTEVAAVFLTLVLEGD